MRSIHLTFALAAAALVTAAPVPAGAKPWQGVNPGTTTAAELTTRFGTPSTQGKLGGRHAYVYKDEVAIGATRQAQFFTRDDGVIVEIVVFPSTHLEPESVEGSYGRPGRKAFTDDLRPVWYYPALGVTVFFGKAGAVEALSFKAGEGAPKSAAAPAGDAASPAP
jgi:hypothetical protein